MKKKLVFASKIIVGMFFLLLFMMIMFVAYEMELPAVIGILFLMFLALAVVVLVIEFVLELWERWKEDGIRAVLKLLGEAILYMVVFMGCDLLMSKEVARFGWYIGYGVVLMIVTTVIRYWKRVGK